MVKDSLKIIEYDSVNFLAMLEIFGFYLGIYFIKFEQGPDVNFVVDCGICSTDENLKNGVYYKDYEVKTHKRLLNSILDELESNY